MSTFSVANAAAAYARNVQKPAESGMEPRAADPGKSFSQFVGESLSDAMNTGKQAENISAQAIAGKADLTDVVTAVTNAEITLQTVVAIRDKAVAAYQEIARMPI
jgi:flagellar hook-basal body complex protein FliE